MIHVDPRIPAVRPRPETIAARLLASTALLAFFVAPLAAQRDADLVRVMVWNVQRGANLFRDGPESALAVIREADPDICLLQESYDIDGPRPTLGRWLAGQLGWNAWQGESPHLCVLTRFEIEEELFHDAWHGVGARLVDRQGRRLWVWSTWIDWRAYLPYELRDRPEATDTELLACETERSDRLAQATALLRHLRDAGQLAGELPLLVGGDWNCPSHLDWTEDAARLYRFRRPLRLPVSIAMQEAGLADAFRVVHPEPVRVPGITWTPLDRGSVEQPTPADRIDRLYLSNPAAPDAAQRRVELVPVAAEVLPTRYEDQAIPAAERSFPSDHAALIVELRWLERARDR